MEASTSGAALPRAASVVLVCVAKMTASNSSATKPAACTTALPSPDAGSTRVTGALVRTSGRSVAEDTLLKINQGALHVTGLELP